MYFEKALHLLANLECLDDGKTNDLVACQVYGQMKKDQDSKADDIHALSCTASCICMWPTSTPYGPSALAR